MKGTDLFDYIRKRGDGEDFFLKWFRGNPRPYRELKEKFSDFREKLGENPADDPQATKYQTHIDQILAAMDDIVRVGTSDVERQLLRNRINKNLEAMGIE
ncbi:MAG: hypothetical protein JJT75_02895 [Opitutales bacterium]|nr:hypothetical protein [Opitutales bacterium]MCH8540381.1 hypothetical protein [Opitutales bacterium]